MISRNVAKTSKPWVPLRAVLGLLIMAPLLGQTVSAASITISPSGPLPTATVGQSYNVSFTATGGAEPYRWTASNEFPAGLALDAQTGIVSGAPTAAGAFVFAIRVIDANQATATATYNMTVNVSPLALITVPPLFAATAGIPYSQPFSASGGKPPYIWSILSGDPGVLTLDSSTGTLHGTPPAAGTFNFVIRVADSAGAAVSKSFSVVVSAPVLTIAVASALPNGAVGVLYSQRLPVAAAGGTPPYQWSIPDGGSIAPGLDFNSDTLTVSGTPTASGAFSFNIQVTDARRQTAAKTLTITIAPPALTITTNRELPDGSLNAAYSSAMAAVGGLPPYSWSASGLPGGLAIDSSTGTIAGVAAAAGTFGVAITVTDSALSHSSDRFTLKVALPPVPAISVSGLPEKAAPAEQYPIQITLASPFPAPLAGQAILTFSPETGPTDKTIQFAGGGTIANFSIPAGSTTLAPASALAVQTGTVSGAISISVRLQAGGIDVTPPAAPVLTTQIGRAAPVISDVRVNRGDGKISLIVSGYSTAREVVEATFTFTASTGQTLQSSASSLSIPLEGLFTAWFQDPASGAYGSQFVLTQPFTVQGDSNAVIPQAVTLTNRAGSITYRIP